MSQNPALADGHHVARGAAANAVIVAAANFRGIFELLVARLLGEATFGLYGLAWTVTELLSKFGVLGLDSSIVPLIAPRADRGDREGSRLVLRRAVAAAGVASLLLILAGWAVATWWPGAQTFAALAGGGTIMLLALPGIAIARISTSASRSALSMRNEFYSRSITETVVTIGVFVIALALGMRAAAPAVAVVAGTSAAAMVAFALASRTLARVPATAGAHAGAPAIGEMVQYSLPTAGANVLSTLVTQADVLILGAFVGQVPGVTPEAFGVYCAASRMAIGMRRIRQVFDPVFAPIVARRSASAQRSSLRETVAGTARWVLAAQLPYLGVLMLSGGALLSLYGPGFRQGALWVVLLGLAHGTNVFAGLVETLLLIERPGLNLINALVTVAVQTVACLALIPHYGITGAALGTSVGFLVQGGLRFFEHHHVSGWSWPWAALGRPALAFTVAFVPAVVVRLSGTSLISEVGAGVLFLLLYAAAWWVLGPEPSDRAVWASLRASRRPAEAAGEGAVRE